MVIRDSIFDHHRGLQMSRSSHNRYVRPYILVLLTKALSNLSFSPVFELKEILAKMANSSTTSSTKAASSTPSATASRPPLRASSP